MDRYDAIREQLKGAQSRGLDTLRERLNQVLDSLEGLKTSVQDALDRPAEEVFPLADIEASLQELEDEPPEPVAPPPGAITLEVIRNLDAARSQSDLLHELMGVLGAHTARTVVLVIRDGAVTAWSGVGFEDASTLEKWQGDIGSSSVLQSLVDNPRPMRCTPSSDPVMSVWLADIEPPVEALLVPVNLRGKLMGAFYADCVADGPWDPDSIQSLVAIGCWLIDTLHHRADGPSPMVSEVTDLEVADEEAAPVEADIPGMEEAEIVAAEEEFVEDAVEEMVSEERGYEVVEEVTAEVPEYDVAEEVAAGEIEVEVVEEAAAEEPETELVEPVSLEEPEVELVGEAVVEEPELVVGEEAASEAPEFEVAEPVEEVQLEQDPTFDPSATVQVDLEEIAEQVQPEEAAPDMADIEVEAAVDAEQPPVEPPPVQAVVPPPPLEGPDEAEVAVEEAAPQLSAEDETRHEEARRFARLLVSEIKLYNEEQVDQGRVHSDLYKRLKEDIDRSREMYEKRISPDIRAARDYFHDELVRILADGNSDALGM